MAPGLEILCRLGLGNARPGLPGVQVTGRVRDGSGIGARGSVLPRQGHQIGTWGQYGLQGRGVGCISAAGLSPAGANLQGLRRGPAAGQVA